MYRKSVVLLQYWNFEGNIFYFVYEATCLWLMSHSGMKRLVKLERWISVLSTDNRRTFWNEYLFFLQPPCHKGINCYHILCEISEKYQKDINKIALHLQQINPKATVSSKLGYFRMSGLGLKEKVSCPPLL